jgi:cyclase
MKLNRTTVALPFAFVTLFAASWVAGAHGPSASEAKLELVAGRVSCIYNMGGNIAVLATEDGALMVDSQFARVAEENDAAVRSLAKQGPVYLVNSHWHGDHVGGNEYFGNAAKIFAHRNVRRRMAADPEIGGRLGQDVPAVALPVMTFESGLKIYLGGEEVQLHHIAAGHTDGDSVIHFVQSKVIHMGDAYNHAGYPFFDLNSGGSVDGLIATIKGVLEWAPEGARFVPGHGRVTGVDEVREYLAMVETVVAAVRAGAAEGKGADELLEAGVTSAYDERWDGGFIDRRKFVEAILADGE